jgi:hypothetical protein
MRVFAFLLFMMASANAQDIGPSPSLGPSTGTGKIVLNRGANLEAPDLGIATATSLILKSFLKLNATTVSSLPTCDAEAIGYKYAVVDAKSPVPLQKVIGGGDVVLSVFCNGANWIIN